MFADSKLSIINHDDSLELEYQNSRSTELEIEFDPSSIINDLSEQDNTTDDKTPQQPQVRQSLLNQSIVVCYSLKDKIEKLIVPIEEDVQSESSSDDCW